MTTRPNLWATISLAANTLRLDCYKIYKMKTAIIIHGYPEEKEYFDPAMPAPSNSHWFPWIQRQLLLKGILTQTPEMPDAYIPNYEKWKNTLEQFVINEETILVGHSCGGGFLIRWLSENNKKVGKVVLVAPWLDPDNDLKSDFFKFEIDKNLVSKTTGLTIMYSIDDYPDVIASVETIKSKIDGTKLQEFSGKGHFVLGDMGTEKFPELLANIV